MANEPEAQVALKPFYTIDDVERGLADVLQYGPLEGMTVAEWIEARLARAADKARTPPEPSGGNEALARLCKRLENIALEDGWRSPYVREAITALRASEAREAALQQRLQFAYAAKHRCNEDANFERAARLAAERERDAAVERTVEAVREELWPKNPQSDWTDYARTRAFCFQLAEAAIRATLTEGNSHAG